MATQAFWRYEQLTQPPTCRRESRDYPLRPVSAAPAPARAAWRAVLPLWCRPRCRKPVQRL